MTNASDESGEGGTLKPRRNVDRRRGRWIRVCRQRIEFTARFLRRPIVAGFNSDSFSTRHIKFMACTVHITHPPERVNTRRPLKGCGTTSPPPGSLLLPPPISLFTLIFTWENESFVGFSTPFPPPRTVLNIYDSNVFTRNFCRATEHGFPPRVVSTVRSYSWWSSLSKIPAIVKKFAVNNSVGEHDLCSEELNEQQRGKKYSSCRSKEENCSSEPPASRDYHLYFAKKFGQAMSCQHSFRENLGSRVKVNGDNLDSKETLQHPEFLENSIGQKFLNEHRPFPRKKIRRANSEL